MLRYYLELALLSLRRSKVLTALMVVAIAFGVGASMTTLTVLHVLSGDPLPEKSSTLYYPQLDPRTEDGFPPGDDPPDQLTRLDAETLLAEGRADRQALMTGGQAAVLPDPEGPGGAIEPFYASVRYTSTDFFPMFDVPFSAGRPWDASEDEAGGRVAVISKELNDKLFAGEDSAGRALRIDDTEFRIVGVLDRWRPAPRFYDLTTSHFTEAEEIYLPYSTSRDLEMTRAGSMDCFDTRPPGQTETDLGAPCTWIQFWVEISSPDDAASYLAFLENYSEEQRQAGRFERPVNVRLPALMDWLEENEVVPSDVQLQTWLALAFFAVCLINTIGLLLAKFLRRAPEIGVRRALGASRRAVFSQCLVESGVIGIAGGCLGLALTLLGLWAVRQQPVEYAELAQLDLAMLIATLVAAIVSSLLAGLLPAWRACQIAPAMQLKSH